MCVTSAVGDYYRDKWEPRPWFPGVPMMPTTWPPGIQVPVISHEEFDKLKAEVEELKGLLKMAKAYDERNGEPACEMDEKMDLLRKVAKLVGVNLDDVIAPSSPRSA